MSQILESRIYFHVPESTRPQDFQDWKLLEEFTECFISLKTKTSFEPAEEPEFSYEHVQHSLDAWHFP